MKPGNPADESTQQEKSNVKANDIKVDKDRSDEGNASQFVTPESSSMGDAAPRNGDDQ